MKKAFLADLLRFGKQVSMEAIRGIDKKLIYYWESQHKLT